jgi:nucleobase transporter 1/2
VLLGILLSWFVAWLLTISGVYNSAAPEVQAACRTDQSNVLANSPWFRFPYPGQWGPIHISWASTLTMLAGGWRDRFFAVLLLCRMQILAKSP